MKPVAFPTVLLGVLPGRSGRTGLTVSYSVTFEEQENEWYRE